MPGLEPFHPDFDQLFAFGIDPVGGDLPSDQPADWPAVAEIHGYNRRIRQLLDSGLEARDVPYQLLHVAIEHRLMHAETLAYMFHQLPLDKKIGAHQGPVANPRPRESGMVKIAAGAAMLGQSSAAGCFGWDNEFEAHSVEFPAFEIDRYKVTNGQYLEFLEENNAAHPVFWKRTGGGWYYRGMFEEIPLPLDWPVYVSHAEASAYARWAGKALPTEPQWQRAALGSEPGNVDFERWDPVPVTACTGLVGNGWEWTSTLFGPFPGFQPFPFYPGYSANFFDGAHYVMKGGSARTAACMLRPSFRNWFQPRYPFVYAGFRCVSR
jgi:iron(II)-dependent oxidoreductase